MPARRYRTPSPRASRSAGAALRAPPGAIPAVPAERRLRVGGQRLETCAPPCAPAISETCDLLFTYEPGSVVVCGGGGVWGGGGAPAPPPPPTHNVKVARKFFFPKKF